MSEQQSSRDSAFLYGVGVGPGDPELVTVKAQRLLQRVGTICFTQLDDGRESYALSVVREFLSEAKPEFISITVPFRRYPSERTDLARCSGPNRQAFA